ncbi:MAG: hypothetical protein K0R14_550 [Burkholderiales bacterium]|jgi:hypothetical protein|nr:hypothetical protein [Burkholderiales bacterium]
MPGNNNFYYLAFYLIYVAGEYFKNGHMGDLPTWLGAIGAIVTGSALSIFAYQQNKINQLSQKIDL